MPTIRQFSQFTMLYHLKFPVELQEQLTNFKLTLTYCYILLNFWHFIILPVKQPIMGKDWHSHLCFLWKLNQVLMSELLHPLWKQVWRFLKKLKTKLPYDPAIPLLDIYLKKTRTLTQKDICTPMFTAKLFTIAKTWKQTKQPLMDEWRKDGIKYSAIKKEGQLEIWNNTDGPWGHYAKWNKSEKDKHHLSVESKNRALDNREQTGDCQRQGGRGWEKWVKVVKKYKLLVIRWINAGYIMHSMLIIVNNTILESS